MDSRPEASAEVTCEVECRRLGSIARLPKAWMENLAEGEQLLRPQPHLRVPACEGLHRQSGLEERFSTAEALVADGDDLAIGKLVGLRHPRGRAPAFEFWQNTRPRG